jgi:catechol 2,3-dioxygenase-like lactoylglutathione lyase family enzyme
MNSIKTLKPHVSLNVSNLEKSIDFYSRLFGIAPAKIRQGYAKFDVHNPPLNFSLNQSAGSAGGSLSHLVCRLKRRKTFCRRVPDGVPKDYQLLMKCRLTAVMLCRIKHGRAIQTAMNGKFSQ